MKTKGISFWEQNVERLVLGFAALVTLALVGLQFIGEPNAVQIGTTTVSPATVNDVLVKRAQDIDTQLQGSSPVNVNDVVKPMLPGFEKQLGEPVVPATRLVLLSPRLPVGGADIIGEPKPFRVATPPTPTEVIARQWFDTLAPEALEQAPELKAVFTAAPHDATWTCVYARFAVADLLKQFAEEGPNGEAALPRTWFNDRVDFIDVKVEREEYVNGEWVNQMMIDPMPGRASFRPELKDKKVDDALRQSIVARAGDPFVRQQIIQPPFYPTLNQVWTPPAADGANAEVAAAAANAAPEDNELADLTRRRDELQKRLDSVLKQLKEAGCAEGPPAPEKPGKDAAAPKTKSGGGGGGGAAPPGGGIGAEGQGNKGGRTGQEATTNAGLCKSLWGKRKSFETKLAQINADIEKIQGQKAAVVEAPKEEVEVKDPEVLNIWAHDLNVVPGKTYRYRMMVEVYNPLFGRKPALISEQQPLAEQFVLASQASEWTPPITVEPPLRVFVTNAQPANQGALGSIGLGSATAEVYRFHNGRWWLERFRVQPGDRVGETKTAKGGANVDYSTDWFVLDVVEGLATDDQDVKRGFGATVVLQSLTTPGMTAARSPRDDYGNPERRRLLDEVKFAELGEGEAVAASGTGGTGPGGTN